VVKGGDNPHRERAGHDDGWLWSKAMSLRKLNIFAEKGHRHDT